MSALRKQAIVFMGIIAVGIIFYACSKTDEPPAPSSITPTNPCTGRTINLVATSVATSPCANSGSVTVTASGSLGFSYSIDGSGFQASSTFSNLAQGDHIYLVKDRDGCAKSSSINVPLEHPGQLYTAVKTLLVNNCTSCHSGPNPNGGTDFTNDCVILSSKERIKARAVDGNPSFMPQGGQLSKVDMAKITDWITAGGRYSD
jgi:hypothetical protein